MRQVNRFLSYFLFLVVCLVAIALLGAVFIPKEYSVERTITFKQPQNQVYQYVRQLKNQDTYSVWSSIDPGMQKSFTGIDGQVGFIAAWESDHPEVGKGEQEITAISDTRIDYELRFLEPFASSSAAYMEVNALTQNQARVRWGFSGHMDYPMNLLLILMDMEAMIGDDFEHGLKNLKDILEPV